MSENFEDEATDPDIPLIAPEDIPSAAAALRTFIRDAMLTDVEIPREWNSNMDKAWSRITLGIATFLSTLRVADGSTVLLGSKIRVVTYTATGVEGLDFRVPISGTPMLSANYAVFWSTAGVNNIPILDPTNVNTGDRTVSDFRVLTAVQMALGETLVFLLIEGA